MCINVLSKEESLILKIIDKIEDHEEKQKALEAYILLAKENPQTRIQAKIHENSQQYSLKEILKRIEREGFNKEFTIADLSEEVKRIDKDLKDLYSQVQSISLKAQESTLNRVPSNPEFKILLKKPPDLCQQEVSVQEIHKDITHKCTLKLPLK